MAEMRRWILTLAAAAALSAAPAAPALAAWPTQFADVDTWPKWAVQGQKFGQWVFWGGDLPEAVWWELMVGDPPADGNPLSLRTFRPHDTITRAEYATILARALGIDTQAAQGAPWYQPAVQALTERGIITTQGNFNVPITRREMGDWVGRSLEWYGVDLSGQAEVDFRDIQGLPEAPYIRLAARAGVIKGYPDGTFGPERTATRAEAAAMAVRVAKQLRKNPPDVQVFEENLRAQWEVMTASEKEVAQGKEYNHTHLLEPYVSFMSLYGPDGHDWKTRAYYSLRRDDSYRELVSLTVEPVMLRDTIALVKVREEIRRVRLDGTLVGRVTVASYEYFAKRGDRWIDTNGEDPEVFRLGNAVPQPEGETP